MDEEEGLGGKIAELREKVEPLIEKVGWRKIALGVLIVILLYWVLFLRPNPGSLSVTVTEIDSGDALVGAEVSLLDASGKALSTEYADDSGRVSFDRVPSLTELTLDVQPDPQHKPSSQGVTLASGERSSLQVKVSRSWNLEIEAAEQTVYAGAGCSPTIELKVTNKGNDAAPIEFVGEGGLAGLVLSNARALNPKTEERMTATVRVPADAKKGSAKSGGVRIKYTNKAAAIAVNVLEAPKLTVAPASIEKKLGESESGYTEVIRLSVAEEGHELDATCRPEGADLAGKATVSDSNPNRKLTKDTSKLFKAVLGPFTSGVYTGQIICETSCGTKSIEVKITKD